MTGARITFDRVWMKFHRGETHDSLRDLLPALARRALGRGVDPAELDRGDFWAVRDLSFEVNPGQVLGLIGANGSGKSTTLRILTRILDPTRGQCSTTGRVGALIEISAGFHGDLTGRENVFLQGAIMGLRAREITRKFTEIVEFAGIGDFIDTPVKRYSSGMNARLGFSIAAHMDPDVLIIDEVLAVGDYMFQERAFGRISDLAKSGIPVVVVSHQLDRVAQLCTEAILLEHGAPVFRGTAEECIAAYVQPTGNEATNDTQRRDDERAQGPIAFYSARILDDERVRSGEWCAFRIEGVVRSRVLPAVDPILVRVRSLTSGKVVFTSGIRQLGVDVPEAGNFVANVTLQANLPPGSYLVDAASFDTLTRRDLARSPAAMLRVSDPGTFHGSVQLNARIDLRAGRRERAG